MSTVRTLTELEQDRAPKWANLRTIQAETVVLVDSASTITNISTDQLGGLLTVRQTAVRLGVHENTIRNWVDKGVLPAVRLPGSQFRRFRPSEVERIRFGIMGALASGRVEPAHDLPSDVSLSFNNSDDQ